MQDSVKLTGKPTITLRDGSGHIKQQFSVDNMVVTAGKSFLAQRMANGSKAVMSHMAIGKSATSTVRPTVVTDTALSDEVKRVQISTVVSNNTVTYSATFQNIPGTSETVQAAIVEAGIFNNQTGGTMLCRVAFSPINVYTADQLDIAWTITVN